MSTHDDGGPAFPRTGSYFAEIGVAHYGVPFEGMFLRDWFAGSMQEDDRLVRCIRAMEDNALEVFALCPGTERVEWLTETEPTQWLAMHAEYGRLDRRKLCCP